MQYTEFPITCQEQVDLLESRGLVISDRDYAIDLLRKIGFYRLNTYGITFQFKKNRYNGRTKIEDIERLYNFDRDLRNLYLSTISRVEIPIRTRISYYLAQEYGPFGYLTGTNFPEYFNHAQWVSNVQNEVDRSKEIFIQQFKQQYQEDTQGLPLWILTEVMSFGSLSLLFSGLKNSDKAEISKEFNVHWKVLKSWLHCLVYTRNICAHHARFWNRTLAIKPLIPRKVKKWRTPFSIDNNKVFSVFAITNYLIKNLSPEYHFKSKIIKFFDEYPHIDIRKIGFVTGWQSHKIWN
ncbi:MAG: Abi family protein [Candidatus Aminicenantes bacterium]|nr:MAG: Abi family protein [Candidatus Aminicenantes bacterium]